MSKIAERWTHDNQNFGISSQLEKLSAKCDNDAYFIVIIVEDNSSKFSAASNSYSSIVFSIGRPFCYNRVSI